MANSMPYSAGASLRIWTVGVVTWRGPKYITLPWELGLFQIVILVSPVTVDVTFVGVVSFLAAVDNVAVVFVIVAVIIVQHIYICVEFFTSIFCIKNMSVIFSIVHSKASILSSHPDSLQLLSSFP